MSKNANGAPPPLDHAEEPMESDPEASESESEGEAPASIILEILSPSVNDEDVDAASSTISEVTSPSVNTVDTAASTTPEATTPSAQEDDMPENANVHANFKDFLEHCVTAYRSVKYPSKEKIVVLSENEVKTFL